MTDAASVHIFRQGHLILTISPFIFKGIGKATKAEEHPVPESYRPCCCKNTRHVQAAQEKGHHYDANKVFPRLKHL